MKKRWRASSPAKREKSGRIRRAQRRDTGTPELLAKKIAMARACNAPGRMEVSACGLDLLWRLDKIDDGERAAGERFRRLYRVCAAGPGLTSGAGTGGLETDLTEEQQKLRRMQRSLTRTQLDAVTEVCALMRYPEWLLHTSRERRALVSGLQVLDKGVRG